MKKMLFFIIWIVIISSCVKDEVLQSAKSSKISENRSNISTETALIGLKMIDNRDYQLLNQALERNFTYEDLHRIATESGELDLEHSYVLGDSLGVRTVAFAMSLNDQFRGLILQITDSDRIFVQYAPKNIITQSATALATEYGTSMSKLLLRSMALISATLDVEDNVDYASLIGDLNDLPEIEGLIVCNGSAVIVETTTIAAYAADFGNNSGTSWEEVFQEAEFQVIYECQDDGVEDPHEGFVDDYLDISTGGGGSSSNSYSLDRADCLKNISIIEKANFLYKMRNYEFPCEERELSEILDDYIDSWCNGNNAGENFSASSRLNHLLDRTDHFELGNLKKECECFAAILSNFKERKGKNWLCDIVRRIERDKSFTQEFFVFDHTKVELGSVEDEKSLVHNKLYKNQNRSVMRIDDRLCMKDSIIEGIVINDLNKSARFIHELLHGYMNYLIAESSEQIEVPFTIIKEVNGESKSVVNPAYMAEVLRLMGVSNPDVSLTNQHVVFYNNLLDFITSSLRQLNNGEGEDSDYLYYAHQIINTQQLSDAYNNVNGQSMTEDMRNALAGMGLEDFSLNNSEMLANWNSIGGDKEFKFNCY